MINLVKRNNGKAITTSLIIAEVFEKRHNNVIRDIVKLKVSDSFRASNFEIMFISRELPNGGHKKDKYYNISREGFVILVMGYTGKKAMKFKESYIGAFNLMETELLRIETSKEAKYFDKKSKLMKQKHLLDIEIKQLKQKISTTNTGKELQQTINKLDKTKNKLVNMEKYNFKHVFTPNLFPDEIENF